ncbi:hypothetical protein B0A49_00378 [Cryomyces minteri]|uniref:RING-type domain-containing protein n=1 Tax=Cryomyces minteri TaxID=331657 RepID=A0A4U0XVI0_9PEZI|nr:hypothetical protein B0A49_02558 [Cryomyces minteri]TKA81892.1 hypothetical protein B0A49_00378 [Cryomyces minteri]
MDAFMGRYYHHRDASTMELFTGRYYNHTDESGHLTVPPTLEWLASSNPGSDEDRNNLAATRHHNLAHHAVAEAEWDRIMVEDFLHYEFIRMQSELHPGRRLATRAPPNSSPTIGLPTIVVTDVNGVPWPDLNPGYRPNPQSNSNGVPTRRTFEAHLRTRRGQGEELYVWSESRQAWGEVINAFGRTHPYVVIVIARNEMADIHVDDEADVAEDYGPGLWEVFPEEDNDYGMDLEDLDDVPKAADPALLAAVAALPRRRFVQSPTTTTDPDAMQIGTAEPQCTICQSSFEAEEVAVTLPCAHEFHEACAEHWLTESRNGSCPLCREPLLSPPPSRCASPLPSDADTERETDGSDQGHPAAAPDVPDARLDHARLEADRWDFDVDLVYAQLDYLEGDIRDVLHRPSA